MNEKYRNEGRDLQFHAIWSNQCVELWFVLHYDYMQSDIAREQYREILSDKLGRHYEKNDDTLFEALLPRLKTAVKNAHKLEKNYTVDAPPSQKVPCTTMYELIEALAIYAGIKI